MGLDLTAYSNVKTLPIDHDRPESELDETWIRAFAYNGFHRSTRGLADHDVPTRPTGWAGTLIAARDYDITGSSAHDWHGGGYAGYGMRRAVLATFAGIPQAPSVITDAWIAEHQDRPFFELVWFADNEGAIGHEAAADLLTDFTEHRDALLPLASHFEHGRSWEQWLDDWITGLTLAADNGLVKFW